MEQNYEHPARQLLAIAEQLNALARLLSEKEEPADSSAESAEASPADGVSGKKDAEEMNVRIKSVSEKADATAKGKQEAVSANSADQTSVASRQIGGGLNGVLGGLRLGGGGLPGLGNLFGGLSGLGNLGVSVPTSPEEIRNNPGMMSMLESLEQNPTLLNTLSAMSGMNREQILQAIRMVRGNSAQTAEAATVSAAEPTTAVAGGTPPMNGTPAELFSELSGGRSLPGAALSPLRGNVGGDPLDNLLRQWHWRPLRS